MGITSRMSDLNVSAQLSSENNHLLCHLDWWEDKPFHLLKGEIIYTIKSKKTASQQLTDFLFYTEIRKGKNENNIPIQNNENYSKINVYHTQVIFCNYLPYFNHHISVILM